MGMGRSKAQTHRRMCLRSFWSELSPEATSHGKPKACMVYPGPAPSTCSILHFFTAQRLFKLNSYTHTALQDLRELPEAHLLQVVGTGKSEDYTPTSGGYFHRKPPGAFNALARLCPISSSSGHAQPCLHPSRKYYHHLLLLIRNTHSNRVILG